MSCTNNISVGWRQARIFTSDFSDHWYFGLLAAFAVPFAAKYPETPFWFTRYNLPKGAGDDNDTKIDDLPANFLQAPTNTHFSIRFRFCPLTDEEAFLESLFTASFWRSDFRAYDVLGEFGGSRFCTTTDITSRLRRTKRTVNLLHAHSLFVLDAFNGTNAFEENSDGQNAFNKSTFLSTLHLFNNVCGTSDGKGFHLYALNKEITAQGGLGWCRL
ncbi:hypothetical protein ACXR0O_19085 [Verrucomicrobiota bacterium sgz303538]